MFCPYVSFFAVRKMLWNMFDKKLILELLAWLALSCFFLYFQHFSSCSKKKCKVRGKNRNHAKRVNQQIRHFSKNHQPNTQRSGANYSKCRCRKTWKWRSATARDCRLGSAQTKSSCFGFEQRTEVCKMFELNKCGNKVKIRTYFSNDSPYCSILTHTFNTTKHTGTNTICTCVMLALQLCLPLGVNGLAPKHHVLLWHRAALFNLMRPCTAWFIYSKIHVVGTRAVCH